MLLPSGLVSYEVGHSDLLFMDSAIFGAIAFWSLVSLAYGYFLRNVKIVYVALGAYPAAVVAMFLFHWVLGIFGYGVYVDGP